MNNMSITPRELLYGKIDLPSLPEVFLKSSELLDDPRSSATQLGEIVAIDPSLTARLLKLVNSPFYGFAAKITTLPRAISLIGMRELRELILATCAVDFFSGLPNDLMDMKTFWSHSVRCALIAKILANQQTHEDLGESMFTAGLLHNIGSLILYNRLPELARDALSQARYQNISLDQTERTLIGFDHAMLGAELMKMWNLPEMLQQITLYHHSIEYTSPYASHIAIIQIANRIIEIEESGEDITLLMPPHSPLWKRIKLSVPIIEETLQQVNEQFDDVLHLIYQSNEQDTQLSKHNISA